MSLPMKHFASITLLAVAVIVSIHLLSSSIPDFDILSAIRTRRAQRQLLVATSIPSGAPTAPDLGWVMSYPCTGSEYVIDTLHLLTGKTTATNYGHIFEDDQGVDMRNTIESQPVYSNRINGPFIFKPNLPVVQSTAGVRRTIPVMTYGGGTCIHCFPGRYVMLRDKFLEQALTGTRFRPSDYNDGQNGYGWTDDVQYYGQLVKSSLRLIRDPFDVVEERFLYYSNLYANSQDFTTSYNKNRAGFLSYCNAEKSRFREEEALWYRDDVLPFVDQGVGLPCYAEFYKIVQWHNRVQEMFELLEARQPPFETLNVYFEDVAGANFVSKANNILQFWNLTSISSDIASLQPPIFLEAGIHDFMNVEEKQLAVDFILKFGKHSTRWLFKRYFNIPGVTADETVVPVPI